MSRYESQRPIVMMISSFCVIQSRQNFLSAQLMEELGDRPALQADRLSASSSRARGDLVEGRVRHLVRLHSRRALHHLLQRLKDTGIRATAICLCVFLQIPHTDADRLSSALGDERDFVLEAFLLPQHRNHVFVDELCEFCGAPRLEMERNTACKHVNLQGWSA